MKVSMLNFSVIALLMFALIVSCNTSNKEQKKKDVKTISSYKIGVNLPLSGNGSYMASEMKKGMDLSFDFMNNEAKRVSLDVIYEDNKLNPKDAVSISRKLLEVDEVDLMLCGYTPIIQATIGLVNDYQVPMLATLTSAEGIVAPYEWAFRDFEMESENMPLLANYAYTNMDLRQGSWLVVNDDMGHDAVMFFSETFNALGGTMLDGSTFENSDMDFRNKINKIMAGNPEFIIVIGRGSSLINACRQIRERYPELPILGNNTLDNDMVWDALGTGGNYFWFPRPYADLESQKYERVNERFKERYGQDINWVNVYGVSIANYLARGLKQSGGDKEAMRQYLQTLNYQSIRGLLIMNKNRDVSNSHVICNRMNGVTTTLETIE